MEYLLTIEILMNSDTPLTMSDKRSDVLLQIFRLMVEYDDIEWEAGGINLKEIPSFEDDENGDNDE